MLFLHIKIAAGDKKWREVKGCKEKPFSGHCRLKHLTILKLLSLARTLERSTATDRDEQKMDGSEHLFVPSLITFH